MNSGSKWIVAVLASLGAASVCAQTTRPGQLSPAEQMLNQMLTVGSAPTSQPAPGSLVPATQPASAPEPSVIEAPSGQVVREGTYIRKVGYLRRNTELGYWEIVGNDHSSAMLLAPNLKLMQLEDAMVLAKNESAVAVVAMATEYRGRNWLVIESWTRATGVPASTKPATGAAGVEKKIDKMLGAVNAPETSVAVPRGALVQDATTGRGAIAPKAPVLSVQREGRAVVDRLGRLTPMANGKYFELTFDADTNTLQDPPVVIIPQLKLQQMQDAVNSSSRDLRFRISGTLTEYQGRNYILLLKAVVLPEFAQQF